MFTFRWASVGESFRGLLQDLFRLAGPLDIELVFFDELDAVDRINIQEPCSRDRQRGVIELEEAFPEDGL